MILDSVEGSTTENDIDAIPAAPISYPLRHQLKPSRHYSSIQSKKRRLLKLLRHFHLDFSKFDSTCLLQNGNGIPAPSVQNAQIIKYIR